MIVKFNLDMMVDPTFPQPNPDSFMALDRSARFRSITVSREEAERLFNEVCLYLEEHMEKADGKSK